MSMNKKVYEAIDNIQYEIDRANELKNELNFESHLGRLITVETRLKILKEFLKHYKQIKHLNKGNINGDKLIKDKILIDGMPKLVQRCKLHFYQLRKLKQSNYAENKMYFTLMIKLLYMFCLRELK